MGEMLVVHGGFNSDENYMYNQIEICDLSKIQSINHYSLQEVARWTAQSSRRKKQKVCRRS